MYEYKDIEYLKSNLRTNLNEGLSNNEAKRRLVNNGKNVLESKKKNGIFKTFINQLKDPMIYILLIAIIISFLLKEYSDAIVIVIVVTLNACIGTIQEIKTEKSLEMLKKLSSNKCNVIREGKRTLIDTSELVIGDLLILESGNSVGADIRIIESNNLKIDESSITGESNPVNKENNTLDIKVKNIGDKINLGYMSTLVVNGNGKGIVINTGMNTEIGKIAKLLKENKDELTPLQKKLASLGKILGLLTVAICVFLFLIAIVEKRNVLEMLISSISLAVAAIPEGLPAVVTIVLAMGMQRMVKVKSMVKKLPSVETLGAVNIVCSDKTGTITENKLKCVGVYENDNFKDGSCIENREFLLNAYLCNNAYIDNEEYKGSSIECELKKIVGNKGKEYKRLEEIEFNSDRKMMSTLNDIEGIKYQFTKGAFDKIIDKCKWIKTNGKIEILDELTKEKIRRIIDEKSAEGKRILAFSYRENISQISEENMIFLGFLAFFDPPRQGVRESVSKFKEAGVKTVMITGDYLKTAYSIAKEVGIASNYSECISGEELDNYDDKMLFEVLDNKTVYARVTPSHKSRIVDILKKKGNIVAMTGDGVNDAPSLKKADIGISMGINGNDVAKEASDMILLDDNFSTIEVAIEEGRVIYNNIKKTILFLLSSNFAEVIVMAFAIMLKLPLPLLATHILLVNLLTDSIPALSLGVDKKENDVMKQRPRRVDEGLFSNKGIIKTFIYGGIIAVLTLIGFFIPVISEIMNLGINCNLINIRNLLETNDIILLKSQTYAFVILSMSELFYSLVARNANKSVLRKDIFENKYLNLAILAGALINLILIFTPLKHLLNFSNLGWIELIVLMAIASSIIFMHQMVLFAFHMKQKIC